MSNDITLPEVQEFIAGFWYHYDEAHFDELAARYRRRDGVPEPKRSGASPFEELMSPELHGRDAVMEWLSEHRKQSPYPLRHHATNIHRTGIDGDVTNARFYIFVNQIANFVPFAVSSGVVEVGVRRGAATVWCSPRWRSSSTPTNSVLLSELHADSRHRFVSARETFSGGVAVITGAGAGIGAGLARYASRLGHDGGARRHRRRSRCSAA